MKGLGISLSLTLEKYEEIKNKPELVEIILNEFPDSICTDVIIHFEILSLKKSLSYRLLTRDEAFDIVDSFLERAGEFLYLGWREGTYGYLGAALFDLIFHNGELYKNPQEVMDYFLITSPDDYADECVYITLNDFIKRSYENKGLGVTLEILDKYKYKRDYWDVLEYYGYGNRNIVGIPFLKEGYMYD